MSKDLDIIRRDLSTQVVDLHKRISARSRGEESNCSNTGDYLNSTEAKNEERMISDCITAVDQVMNLNECIFIARRENLP